MQSINTIWYIHHQSLFIIVPKTLKKNNKKRYIKQTLNIA
jgi:hypothetical protein